MCRLALGVAAGCPWVPSRARSGAWSEEASCNDERVVPGAAYRECVIVHRRSSPAAPLRRADACVADAELRELSCSKRSTLREPTGHNSDPSGEHESALAT